VERPAVNGHRTPSRHAQGYELGIIRFKLLIAVHAGRFQKKLVGKNCRDVILRLPVRGVNLFSVWPNILFNKTLIDRSS
jgi:hypothetical protein